MPPRRPILYPLIPGCVVRPVSNLVSIGVPALSARGHLRRSGTRDQGWVANMRHCPCPAGEHDDGRTWRRRLSAQPGRGPSPVTHCLVDESPKGSRQWVGRLELHVACLRRLRPGAYRSSHLWVLGTFSDRSCPLLSAVRRSAADPARTEWSFRSRLVADAFGAPVLRDQGPIGRPGTARPMKALATVLFVSGPHWLSFDLAGWPLICGEIVLL
jgi:hypothetical protein